MRAELRHPAKFRWNRWNCGRDMAIFQFFNNCLVIGRGMSMLWESKIALSHWQSQPPLTQGWRYRAACENGRDVCSNIMFYMVFTICLIMMLHAFICGWMSPVFVFSIELSSLNLRGLKPLRFRSIPINLCCVVGLVTFYFRMMRLCGGDSFCCKADLNNFVREVSDTCANYAERALPSIRKHGSRGCIRDWSELV